jgi:hypothetical protein
MSDFCMFHVFGDTLVPEEISAVLGIKPDSMETKGERHCSKISGRERVTRTGYWAIYSHEHVKSLAVGDHLFWIISQFDPKLLHRISGIDGISLSVVTEMKVEMGGITIPKKVVEFAAAAGASIDVNVDYVPEDEDESTQDGQKGDRS